MLTLLRQEFPDVTISKIRFLESQGLVNPERTPSGYRKFYEHDVERLRWVLRQQREHFLPLKVIKDRLEDDGVAADLDRPADEGATTAGSVAPRSAAASHATPGPSDGAATASVAPRSCPCPTPRCPRRIARGRPRTSRAAAPDSGPGDRRRRGPGIGRCTGDGGLGSRPAHDARAPPTSPRATAAATGPRERTEPTASGGPVLPTAQADDTRRRGRPPAPHRRHRTGPGPNRTCPDAPGAASLSLEDLCSASGLSTEGVAELQEYGLLSASVTAGVEFFDDEALTVARLAARFAAFGIEARHLRLYKNAAEREAGFIEQVVIPMVRQRNPEARARATQTAEDLAGLGQQLRASLLRSALRDLLNP